MYVLIDKEMCIRLLTYIVNNQIGYKKKKELTFIKCIIILDLMHSLKMFCKDNHNEIGL